MTRFGILICLVVSISLAWTLNNRLDQVNTVSLAVAAQKKHIGAREKYDENAEILSESPFTLLPENREPNEEVTAPLFVMSKAKRGAGDSRGRAITSDDILEKDFIENNHPVLERRCFTVLQPCAKTCVCSECPDTREFLVNCSGKSIYFISVGIPSNVTCLILSNNYISQVPSLSFKGLRNLEVLDMSNNNLSRLENDSFVDLVNLKSLLLNQNSLKLSNISFHPGIFRPLQKLTMLNLKLNQINREPSFQYFDSEIGELSSLEELYMDGVSYVNFGAAYSKLQRLNKIDLSGSNSLEYLGPDMFSSLKHVSVKILNISHGYIKTIHPDSFKYLTKIDTLDLSHNQRLYLNSTGISFDGLMNSPIRRIFARNVHPSPTLSHLHTEDLKYLNHTHLEELYLGNNTIAQLDISLITVIPRSLRVMSISCNDIQTYFAQILKILLLKNLEYLYASYQEAWHGMCGFGPDPGSPHIMDPKLGSKTRMQDKSFSLKSFPEFGEISPVGVHSFDLPPNLTEVQFSHTYKLRLTIPKMHINAPKAKKVDLSYNLLHRWKGPITGLESLEEIDLSGNTCYDLSPAFFSYFKSLQTLKIGNNLLGPYLDMEVFDGLSRLQFLDMHTNRLEEISPGLFSDLRELKVLNLSSNVITSWNCRISHLTSLTRLDLTSNKLSSLPSELLSDLDEISAHTNVNMSLKGNPLLCNCATKYFVGWLIHTKVQILDDDSTNCILNNGNRTSLARPELISTYNVLQVHCRTFSVLIALSSCIIFIAICTVTGKILHRYRWKLRYLYYMAVNTGERTGYEHLDGIDQPPFTFNSFISYEDSLRDFVRLEMLPKLETEAGLKLCIDKRDFIPGFYVADNIMNAIQNSSKTVVLLSKKFLESKWCMYEFNMARMESIYNDRHSLVVVLMETIPVNQFPAEVLDILHNKSYITKTDDPDGMALFWRQLTAGIRLDNTNVGRC